MGSRMPDPTRCPDCHHPYDAEPRHIIIDQTIDTSERGIGWLIESRLICPP